VARKRRFAAEGAGGGGGHDAAGGLRWLLTYADMITLLLALFIYFYSVSVVSDAKVAAFSEAMARTFGIFEGSNEMFEGGPGFMPHRESARPPSAELDPEIEARIAELEKAGFVLGRNENELWLRLSADVLFRPGSNEFSVEADPRLANLSMFFKQIVPNAAIRIEGHTDNSAAAPAKFGGGNWELSAIRAAAVADVLVTRYGVDPQQLTVTGCGPFRPVAGSLENQSEDEQTKNRRVEFVILLDEAARRKSR
jgi:chemotaxis protein MotB